MTVNRAPRRTAGVVTLVALLALPSPGQNKPGEKKIDAHPVAAVVKHVTGNWVVVGQLVPLHVLSVLRVGDTVEYRRDPDHPNQGETPQGETPRIELSNTDGVHVPLYDRACTDWTICRPARIIIDTLPPAEPLVARTRDYFVSLAKQASGIIEKQTKSGPANMSSGVSSKGHGCGPSADDGIAIGTGQFLDFSDLRISPPPTADGSSPQLTLTPVLPQPNTPPTFLQPVTESGQWKGTVAQGLYRYTCDQATLLEGEGGLVLVVTSGDTATQKTADLNRFRSVFSPWKEGGTNSDYRTAVRAFLLSLAEGSSN